MCEINISEFVLLPHNIVNIEILSLNFFSRTTKFPFKSNMEIVIVKGLLGGFLSL